MPKSLVWINGQKLIRDSLPEDAPTPVSIEVEREGMVCSRFQAKAALAAAGLLSQVETAVASADPTAQLAWAEAIEFRRNSPTILALAAVVGLTETQIDDLFRSAMMIEA